LPQPLQYRAIAEVPATAYTGTGAPAT